MKLFARSSARLQLLLLLLIVSLLLTACASSSPQFVKQMPPQVRCAAHRPAHPLPPIPDPLTLDSAQIWMAKAIGTYRVEVNRRVTTAQCLDGLRKTGVIR